MYEEMDLPCYYEGMPMDIYNSDPAPEPSLRSSIIRSLVETAPAKARLRSPRLNPEHRDSHSSKFDLGSAAHLLWVGGGEEIEVIAVRNKNGEPVTDYRTKAAQEARDEAYANGLIPLLEKDYDRALSMAQAAHDQFGATEIGEVVKSGQTLREASVFWKNFGVCCRCRPDLLLFSEDGLEAPATIVHYKTTEIQTNPRSLTRFAATLGWHTIAAHYHAGLKALTGHDPVQYFAVQEVNYPYLCMVVQLHSDFLEFGKSLRDRALETWGRCLRENHWPNHPPATVELAAPNWLAYELDDMESEKPEDDFGGL